MNFTQIDFSQAWIRHSMFKTRLRAYLISGTGDAATLSDPKACSLGGWLKDLATNYAITSQSVLEVTYLHEEVHHEAARIISLYNRNQVEEARTRLSKVDELDKEILNALNDLQREVAA